MYFTIFIDFGFNLSATREISIHRDKRERVSEIFASVIFIKFSFMVISFLILIGFIFFIPKFTSEWIVFLFAFGIVVSQVIFPIWFFQGMEAMKYITLLNFIERAIFLIAIFILIRKSSDYIFVPLIQSLGQIIVGIISIVMIFRSFKVKPLLPKTYMIIYHLKKSSQYFLSRASVSIYTSSNIFLLGLFTNNTIVGYYSAAEKIYKALLGIFDQLNTALYPHMSKYKNVSMYKKLFLFVMIIAILLSFSIFIFAKPIVAIVLGEKYQISVKLLKIFALIILFVIPSRILGYPFLGALGQVKYANKSVIIGSIIHIVGLCLLASLSLVSLFSVVIMVLITEATILAIRFMAIKKHQLWRSDKSYNFLNISPKTGQCNKVHFDLP
jgi:PST family polysaccharide transporter